MNTAFILGMKSPGEACMLPGSFAARSAEATLSYLLGPLSRESHVVIGADKQE